ncbi:MAG TPA: hypothetical protein EYG06_10605 [Myxococcales bacterium]|nr:hypothetical protein [Myxococcales bacterium]
MARRNRKPIAEGSATKTLDEIESAGDRLVFWLAENQRPILAAAAGILIVAGGWGYVSSSTEEANSQADTALSEVQTEYRLAMGAAPGSISIPELANPEAAREIREEYIERYTAVGAAHAGSGPGGVAFLEAGRLHQALGDSEAAVMSYQAGLDSLSDGDALRGFLWSRLGSVYEQAEQWAEAANAYTQASTTANYALQAGDRAAAIRAYIHAGEPSAALGMADELVRSEPNFTLPKFLQAQLDELRVGTTSD